MEKSQNDSKQPLVDLDAIFARIPLLKGYRPEEFQINPLAGYTNRNFHLKKGNNDWVLRIPREETNRYINRLDEANNAYLAEHLGLSPQCIWRDESGLSLSSTVQNSRCLTKRDLTNDGTLASLIDKIAVLHNSSTQFLGKVDLERLLIRYHGLLTPTQQSSIEAEYLLGFTKLESLSSHDVLLVPSHNDLVFENILLDSLDQIWLIDWEYATPASPYWDLATLCNEADFDRSKSEYVLGLYRLNAGALDISMLMDYRFILRLLTTCWMGAFSSASVFTQQR